MPAWAVFAPLALLAVSVQPVQYKAGSGGGGGSAGGQVIYCNNCVLGGPAGGPGGPGGNAVNAGAPPPRVANAAPPPSSTSSSSIIAKCSLRIAGSPVVDARNCYYEKFDRSFSIVAGSDNRKYIYKMSIALNDDKTGRGTLSGGKVSTPRPLGTMTRERACWVSLDRSVELCAWK